jgi:hypothetical protein
VSLISVWQYVGIPMMLIYAALLNIPDEVIEAAECDGITGWSQFWKIKLPLILPAIGIISILTFVGNFNAFDLIYTVQGALAGPDIRPISWAPCSTAPSSASSCSSVTLDGRDHRHGDVPDHPVPASASISSPSSGACAATSSEGKAIMSKARILACARPQRPRGADGLYRDRAVSGRPDDHQFVQDPRGDLPQSRWPADGRPPSPDRLHDRARPGRFVRYFQNS